MKKSEPASPKKTTPITLHLPPDLLTPVDKLAEEQYEGNRQMAIRQLLRDALKKS